MATLHWRLSLIFLGLLVALLGCAALIRLPGPEDAPRFIPYNPGSDVIFSHDTHEDDCTVCHPDLDPDIETLEEVKDRSRLKVPSKEACFECHNRGEDCSFCHKTLRSNVRPPSHTQGFKRHHDAKARSNTSRCDWCHGRGSTGCQDCHTRMEPASHGPRWKNSSHGRVAVHNRDRCFVCHRSDECARCHSQPPEYHNANFRQGGHRVLARRKLRSCRVCHDFQRTCSQCH